MNIETNFYTLTFYDNLVHAELFSSWDEHVCFDFINDIRRVGYEPYKDKSWAIIVDGTKWLLFTPDAEKFIIGATSTLLTNLTHNAMVTGGQNVEIKKWIGQRMFTSGKTFETKIFEKVKDAETWLASFGYRMTPLAVESKSRA